MGKGLRLRGTTRGIGAIVAGAAFAAVAAASEPVAIVEDVISSSADVGLFDYLRVGRTIELGTDGSMVIGYFASCRREMISGGVITIGAEQSDVAGGTVSRELVQCDGGALQLTDAQAAESGVLVLRKTPGDTEGGRPEVALTIYATKPLFRLAEPADEVVVTRLDRPDKPITLDAGGGSADLAAAGHQLKRGGLYRAVAGEREIVFRVDKFSRSDGQPLLSRLVPL